MARRKTLHPAVRKAIRAMGIAAEQYVSTQLSNGKRPRREEMVALLRDGGGYLPRRVRNYIADLLEGSVRFPKGRPPAKWPRWVKDSRKRAAARDVKRIQRVWKDRYGRTRGAFEHGINWAAKRWRVDPEALRNYMRRSSNAR